MLQQGGEGMKKLFLFFIFIVSLIAPAYCQSIYTASKSSNDTFWKDSPFAKQESDAITMPSRMFTVKYVYYYSTIIRANISNRNFAGTGFELSSSGDYTTLGGMGIAMEIETYKDVLFGLSINTDRKVTHAEGMFESSLGNETYSGDYDNANINLSSIYVKGRYSLTKQTEKNFNLYIAGKLAYNLVGKSGSDFSTLTIDSGLGVGASIGLIFNDSWDIELGFDSISGGIKEKVDLGGGFADTVDGTYQASNYWTSLGYRF